MHEAGFYIYSHVTDNQNNFTKPAHLCVCLTFYQSGLLERAEDLEHTNEASLKGTWRMTAYWFGQDSTNSGAWHNVNYNKVEDVTEIYCVYDSRVNQSFLSKTSCAYPDANFIGHSVDASACAQRIYLKETTWHQQIKNDINLLDNSRLVWEDVIRFPNP